MIRFKKILKKTSLTIFGLILLAWGTAMFAGCDECDDCYILGEDTPPAVPRGLYSITGDGEVHLFWIANTEEDFDFYAIYRSLDDVEYNEIATTTATSFVDHGLTNGVTYYYAITAVDEYGLESDPSFNQLIFDTPRPEGLGFTAYDYFTNRPRAAFDFSAMQVVDGDDVNADVWFDIAVVPDVFGNDIEQFFINVADDMTDIQDFGFANDLDDVGWAPAQGWSEIGYVELIEGHTYIVWTWDDHFAKLRVNSIDYANGRISFDWAYQPSNDDNMKYELKIVPDGRQTSKQPVERPEGYGDRIKKDLK